jgi:type II secretory ATPase GspE/PulE/Tfp pilus assembly ATPase PilB-like protein
MSRSQFTPAKKTQPTDYKQAHAGAEDKNIIKQVDRILEEAVAEGATEIHIEPHQDSLQIRTRLKGSLKPADIEIPGSMKSNVINRVKVLSGMDITRTKIPQTGFFKLTVDDKAIELYSYVMPCLYGESTIIRVQYKQSATMQLEQLGMVPTMLASLRKALGRGSGLFLVTGPPGSGKRTTAYAAVLEVLQPDMLAMGFDPMIKYEIPGMIQSKPVEKSEFTFAEGIEALLKQEPDVAYVGDLTCLEEIRAAIQGAFAKRRVICRMNANDCVNALQNMIDMGVQPFLLSASLAAICNQRLLRRLCPSCRQPYAADETIQKEIGVRLQEGTKFFKAKGCQACENTGYSGVQVIFELFLPSEELNKMIVAKEPVQAIREQAGKEGMLPLKLDGVGKAIHGLVALEDVLNAL